MSAIICPTITASNPHEYRAQLERITPFAERIHVDFMDGEFAHPKSISLVEAHWPRNIKADLHLMYRRPAKYLHVLQSLRPFTVIVHAEADGDFMELAASLHEAGLGVGLALLPETSVDAVAPALPVIDHVLVFSGHLGHQGGVADMALLTKVRELRQRKPELEIGWDGGVNISNVWRLADNGVNVLNVGGFIQHAVDPANAYATLEALT